MLLAEAGICAYSKKLGLKLFSGRMLEKNFLKVASDFPLYRLSDVMIRLRPTTERGKRALANL